MHLFIWNLLGVPQDLLDVGLQTALLDPHHAVLCVAASVDRPHRKRRHRVVLAVRVVLKLG